MNQKEIIVAALMLIGLVFTAASLTKEKCYDCNQSVFSSSSSCSYFGGTCVKTINKAGFSGLLNYLTGIKMIKNEKSLTFSCSPSCSITFTTEIELADSVNYIPPNTHQ